jgi:hypothetical protein
MDSPLIPLYCLSFIISYLNNVVKTLTFNVNVLRFWDYR